MPNTRVFKKFSRWFSTHRFSAILGLAAVVVFGGVFLFIAVKGAMFGAGMALYQPPPVAVAVTQAHGDVWQDELHAIGTIEADRGVDVAAEVGGTVREIGFRSGKDASAGDMLIQLDDSIEQADLKNYEAQLELARINAERDRHLIKTRAISKTEFDTGQARLKELEALRERTSQVIKQKRVQAPFAGRLGIRRVSIGQYVTAGEKLVTLQALDQLHVDFTVPEQHLPLLKIGSKVRFNVRAHGDREFEGRLLAVDSRVDADTRNVRVRAVMKNPDRVLVPGMFADMRVVVPKQQDVVVVPSTAVSPSLYGDAVYVLKTQAGKHEGSLREPTDKDGAVANMVAAMAKKAPKDKKDPLLGKDVWVVERRPVQVGERRNNYVAVSGVKAGEQIVIAGTLKLKQDTRVIIDNSVRMNLQ
jgi:membrane fusion protein (multidrug efflux system)